jgi:hypothetical protein
MDSFFIASESQRTDAYRIGPFAVGGWQAGIHFGVGQVMAGNGSKQHS